MCEKPRLTNCQVWWHLPLGPALERERQADLSKFEAIIYIESSKISRAI